MKKLLNYKSLLTILASVVVLFNVIIAVFKVNINIEAVVSISLAVIGVLVSIGIVKKNNTDKTIENKEELLQLLEDNQNSNETNVKNCEKNENLNEQTQNKEKGNINNNDN